MRKIIVVLYLIIVSIVFAKLNDISMLNDLSCEIVEKIYINSKTKERRYSIEYIAPDYLRKRMLFPEINKDEIYQYEKDNGFSYIPIFDEIVKLDEAEIGGFLSIIELIKNSVEKNKKIRSLYYKKQLKELPYLENYKIKIKKYDIFSNYLLPVSLDIYEKNSKIMSLELKNIKVDSSLKRKDIKDGVYKN